MRHIIDAGSGRVSADSAVSGDIVLDTGRTELGAEVGVREECKHPFNAYFVKNWDNSRQIWCAFERQNACTLGNNTNNRIESSRKQLKELVDSFMQVDERIVSIMIYQAQAERKLLDAVYKLSVEHNPKYDREMDFLSKLVSEHACELVYEQYNFVTITTKYNFHEAVPGVYFIRCDADDEDALDEPRSEYSVTKTDWTCSCLFMLLNSRWLLSSLRVESELPQLSEEPFRVSRVLKETNACSDSNRKFREANFVATSISEHLSGLGMVEYRAAMKALRGVATLFKHGQYTTIPEIAGEDSLSDANMDTTGGARHPTTDSEEVSEALEVGQVIPRQAEDVSQRMVSASSVESTQVCADQSGSVGDEPDSGDDQSGSVGDNLVSVAIETGADGDELDAEPAQIATEAERVSIESETSQDNDDHSSMLALANLTDDFQIMSPPKTKGRPKQKPRAVKAKWNQTIAMAQEDLDMHERQMSLLTVYELLDGEPVYKSTHEKLLQFKEFLLASKPKPPIAHEMSKLPPTKPLMRPEMVLALEIVGVGVFANSTISLMRKWHTAVKFIKKIKRAMTWIERLDFTRHGNSSFYVEEDPAIPVLLENLPILSNNVLVINPSNIGISNGAVTTDSGYFQRALAGVTKKMKVLFPINCNNNHCCTVLMDMKKGRVYVYDSMASSYAASVRVVAQKMIMMLPDGVRPSARLVTHDPGLGVQSDSYNCGVYVLLAFEIFCGSEPPRQEDCNACDTAICACV
ncbi:hypothetical protein F441_18732 [Phytophthora nicotianae CJ01A1]|uniref:Ubiquitin-like protease family profile domain-containing protein n=1 Tax=Phytophthora nicotianae CJ01A1 TaxID=1317063 RepID=W2W260_PHYNI|nr:hypothetical protein F441_18732 [Phytophthora nicotianae CJ01A1]